LHDNSVQLGIISDVGQETEEDVRRALEEGRIYDLFESGPLVYGRKNSPEIFRRAAEQAGHSATPERCLFVGEIREERSYALESGFRVAPHPRLALEVRQRAGMLSMSTTLGWSNAYRYRARKSMACFTGGG
jgi:bacterial leucyl aminopeptidase